MNHSADTFLRFFALCVAMGLCCALPGCSTSSPSNSAPKNTVRTDEDMKPDRILEGGVKLRSAGTFRTEGAKRREVDFLLERDNQNETIAKLQDLLGTVDFTLVEKSAHVAQEPEPGTTSLWMSITTADGASDRLLIMGETSLVTSDKVNDWHWSGSNLATFYKLVDILAPTSEERHVEHIKEAPPEESHTGETETRE